MQRYYRREVSTLLYNIIPIQLTDINRSSKLNYNNVFIQAANIIATLLHL